MRKLNNASFFKSSFTVLNSKEYQLFVETFHRKTKVSSGKKDIKLIFSDMTVKKIGLINSHLFSFVSTSAVYMR